MLVQNLYSQLLRTRKRSFNQQAEAVAMEGAEHWTRCQARSSSSLEEPLAGASQHEHKPAA